MRRGEAITVERVPAGLYKITLPEGTVYVGSAASTIIVLANSIFRDEAGGDMLEDKNAA